MMRQLRAFNRTRRAPLVTRGEIAETWWARLRGLLGHKPLETGEGLLLRGEKAIHMIGMTFALDIVFLDRAGRVVRLLPNLAPLRFSPFVAQATDVLELPAGSIARTGTQLGDQIDLEIL